MMADPILGAEARVAVGRCTAAIDKLTWMTTASGRSVSGALQALGEGMAKHNQDIENASKQLNPADDPVVRAIDLLSSGKAADRIAACLFLGDKKDKRAVEPLMAVIRGGDREVTPAAAEALATIGAADKRDELAGLLSSENVGSRLGAVHALGRLGDKSVLQSLKNRVPVETDPQVTAALADVIKRFTS
jgi:HEAT repeat protein